PSISAVGITAAPGKPLLSPILESTGRMRKMGMRTWTSRIV
ncbi:hypothetical protein TorRG33x02_316830, partial [Trema orientale]